MAKFFNKNKLQRWIGVNYKPETEMESHYGETCNRKWWALVRVRVLVNLTVQWCHFSSAYLCAQRVKKMKKRCLRIFTLEKTCFLHTIECRFQHTRVLCMVFGEGAITCRIWKFPNGFSNPWIRATLVWSSIGYCVATRFPKVEMVRFNHS